MMLAPLWEKCVENLTFHFQESHINTWVRPIHAVEQDKHLKLFAPNRHVLSWVNDNCLGYIKQSLPEDISVSLLLESASVSDSQKTHTNQSVKSAGVSRTNSRLKREYRFDNFVQGKNNQLAYAAAERVALSPGQDDYNPLFIYGGVGLGKTHLIHALGNAIVDRFPNKKVLYLSSENFVNEMVTAIRNGTMSSFKEKYRSIDTLLVDDIQLFVGKKQSQEEFFHTFNTLFENGQQIVLTSDRYPKNIDGLQERLVSRFIRGLAQAIEPPGYETRVAILSKKAEREQIALPENVLSFIAKQVRSNVRELEGALRSVVIHAQVSNLPVTLDFAKETLKDLIASNNKKISFADIQKTICEYYRLRIHDLLSKKRTRSIVRPRQMAMLLSRELTNHSLPEIGEAFGGRDHTTVINACQRMQELFASDADIEKDHQLLVRILSSND